ncbi:hypothetical protein CDL15_Pgr008111 [Punica granatum]|uniref:FAS1 domain-containing protein n=1 Tax=Punica granatum TaxID=22663 RepID=A0A218W4C6_PUNGR|nr:hypothetical protein CDL15_Pgr008111 [Punica granatum]PKI36307.1 hypothetical protein CRG98_043333 [Punica granatum]
MANSFLGPLFVSYALLITAAAATFIPTALTATSSLPPTTVTAPPQAYSDHDFSLQQLYNIIDALIGTGDFGNWANFLSTTDPSMFPLSATVFVPGDSAFSSFSDHLSSSLPDPRVVEAVDPFLFAYHIVPQRLSYSDLMLFPINSRLPTLLLDKSILIANNSHSNFTLNRSRLTWPDLLSTPSVSVHGISDVLDYTMNSEADSMANHSDVPPMPQFVPPMEQDNSPELPLPPQELETPPDLQVAPPALGIASQASCSIVSSAEYYMPIICLGWLLGLIKIPRYTNPSSSQ